MEKNQKRYVVGAINVTDSQSTVIAEEFKIGFPDNWRDIVDID